MRRRRGPRNRASIYLLGVCIALASVIYLELNREPPVGDGVTVANPSSAAEDAPPPPAAFSLPPLAAYSVIVERPLFSTQRRPPVKEEETPEAIPPPRLILTGVLISGDGRLVLLRRVGSKTIIRASEGDEIEGWRIEIITADRVVLRYGDAVEEVTLDDAAPPAQESSKVGRK